MRISPQITSALSQNSPLVVGSISELSSLSQSSLPSCDLLELRIDSLGHGPDILNFAKESPLPLLITARGPAEGGQSQWTLSERAAAYQALMPYASLIDIELQDISALSDIVSEARTSQILVIGSFHDFKKTPLLPELTEKIEPSLIDIHKFALMANSLDDIKIHCSLIDALAGQKFALMGMGPLGAAARPLMAQAGSILNYGYLGNTPTAPNQWPAELLQEAISL